MKHCPQCEKENPSNANHCMYCGTLLIVEEELSEEAKLQRKLNEANETIQLLKKSLMVQEQTEKQPEGEINATIQSLENQLSAEQQKSNEQKENIVEKESIMQIDQQPSWDAVPTDIQQEDSGNDTAVWLWIFMSVISFVSLVIFYFVSQ